MTALSNDPYDQHDYGDPDDAVVKGDTLRCCVCRRYDSTVNSFDLLCDHCYEQWQRSQRLWVVGR